MVMFNVTRYSEGDSIEPSELVFDISYQEDNVRITGILIDNLTDTCRPTNMTVDMFVESSSGYPICMDEITDVYWRESHPETYTEKGWWEEVFQTGFNEDPTEIFSFSFSLLSRFIRVKMMFNRNNEWSMIQNVILLANQSLDPNIPINNIQQHINYITKGVKPFMKKGTPGLLELIQPQAFPILGVEYNDDSNSVPVFESIGAISYINPSKGKVVAFSHDFILEDSLLEFSPLINGDGERAKFLSNLLRWCFLSNLYSAVSYTIKISIIGCSEEQAHSFISHLRRHGCSLQLVYASQTAKLSDFERSIASHCEVIVLMSPSTNDFICQQTDPRVALILNYLNQGNTFIAGLCPWGWQSVRSSSNLVQTSCLPNHIMEPCGVVFLENYHSTSSMVLYPTHYNPNNNDLESFPIHLGHGFFILEKLIQLHKSIKVSVILDMIQLLQFFPLSFIKASDPGQTTLQSYHRHNDNSVDDCEFLQCILRRLLPSNLSATMNFPITVTLPTIILSEPLDFLSVYIQSVTLQHCQPDHCPIASGISTFPGIPNMIPEEEKILRLFTVSLNQSGWQSTGFYIPPGDACTIECLTENTDLSSLMIKFRINCHSDIIKFQENDGTMTLKRWPALQIVTPWCPFKTPSILQDQISHESISAMKYGTTISIASPFGGLLYVEIPDSDNYSNNAFMHLGITGSHLAPWYLLNKTHLITTQQSQLSQSRYNPSPSYYPHLIKSWKELKNECLVPWGELEGDYVILTLPRNTLLSIVDPIPLIQYWDIIVKDYLELSYQQLKHKERIVPDIQISAGYMHAGYPIMTHLDICESSQPNSLPRIININQLNTSGLWGLFHELGHNRQCDEWTPSGTEEVTVNIFSLYACFTKLGQTPYQTEWFLSYIPDCLSYLTDDSATFEQDWKSNYGVALGPYAGYIERYGFQAIKKVFLQYTLLKKKPESNEDKLTEWVQQTSIAVSHNLSPFYRLWKWPFDETSVERYCSQFPIDIEFDVIDGLQKALENKSL